MPTQQSLDGKLREILEKPWIEYHGNLEIKPNIKPTHGSCCTCQICGYIHDECNCSAREIVKYIDQALTALKSCLVEEIKNKKIKGFRYDKGSNSHSFQLGYNQAIDDVVKLLGEKK